jgi:anti-sigma factor RsiW
MSCRELVELVTEYLDAAMTPADRAAFEAHLEECHDCTVYLDQMRQTIAALGDLPPERLPQSARDELLALFRGWAAA